MRNSSQNHSVFTDEIKRQRARLCALLQGKGYAVHPGRLRNRNGSTPLVQQLITRTH